MPVPSLWPPEIVCVPLPLWTYFFLASFACCFIAIDGHRNATENNKIYAPFKTDIWAKRREQNKSKEKNERNGHKKVKDSLSQSKHEFSLFLRFAVSFFYYSKDYFLMFSFFSVVDSHLNAELYYLSVGFISVFLIYSFSTKYGAFFDYNVDLWVWLCVRTGPINWKQSENEQQKLKFYMRGGVEYNAIYCDKSTKRQRCMTQESTILSNCNTQTNVHFDDIFFVLLHFR